MLVQFETKTQRVKGLCFHPTRPWLLSSLKSGEIQLWDHNKHVLIEVFEEHEGPVRCVDFHPKQPLFVSAGDDQKIKVWNYQQKKCQFTLVGHTDYIRTCYFHPEHPWIISASDDNIIRIWNWQSRSCIAVLTGHNHYVMCAQFHSTQDLIVSASLDSTARIWDISGLRQKSYPGSGGTGGKGNGAAMQQARGGSISKKNANGPDLFGGSGAVVKHILEGHDRGVNWASFHATQPLVVTASDDRTVKLWRFNDHKAMEIETFRGHFNNVSCAIFHPHMDLILSNSEDKHIRVWDMQSHTCIKLHRREKDRFWILAAGKESNTFGAGHENGFITFKLERERPSMSVYQNSVYYVKNRVLRMFDMDKEKDFAIMQLKRPASITFDSVLDVNYNPAENAILLTSSLEGASYEMYLLPKNDDGKPADAKRALGISAVWVARNRFAVLDKSKSLVIKDMDNETSKQFDVPYTSSDKLFYAGTGQVLIRSDDHLNLFDLQQKKSIAEIDVQGVKRVTWSPDNNYIALQQKHGIVICDKNFQQQCQVTETNNVKSAVWDPKRDVLVYTTSTHIKYLLINGDYGIIRTLDIPIYLTSIDENSVFCLDRNNRPRLLEIEATEYKFKYALVNNNYDQVLYMIQTSKLIGQSIISYLQKKGYPEIALHFVSDVKAKFSLAIECGNMEIALETAKELDDEVVWNRVADKALELGDHKNAELAFQRTKNLQKLCFLYLVTGNIEKLEKLGKVASWNNDPSYQYQMGLFTGSMESRVQILNDAGLHQLAYLTAKCHGMTELINKMKEHSLVPEDSVEIDAQLTKLTADAKLLLPPISCQPTYESNWPQLTISKSVFEHMGAVKKADGSGPVGIQLETKIEFDEEIGGAWGNEDDELILDDDGELMGSDVMEGDQMSGLEDDGDGDDNEYQGWDMDEDLDLPDDTLDDMTSGDIVGDGGYNLPALGPDYKQRWLDSCVLPCEFIAAGDLETAMKMLNSSIGVCEFGPLKENVAQLLTCSQSSMSGIPSLPSLINPIHFDAESTFDNGLPLIPNNLDLASNLVQKGYQMTTKGNFSGAIKLFKEALLLIPFLKVNTKQELSEAQQVVSICREYITGLSMESKRQSMTKTSKSDIVRACELAAYFSHCDLQPAHLVLTLRVASTAFFKIKNFKMAQTFARRMLELGPPPAQAQQARKIVAACQKNLTDNVRLDYDAHNPFTICPLSYTPVYQGSPSVGCPFCGSKYKPEHEGGICVVCEVSKIGKNGSGLFISHHQRK